MVAYAAVASLMNNIEQIMNHPHLSASLDDRQIQPLLKTADFLLDFIEGCNPGGVTSKEVEDVERQIASAAHAAEDVIESHIVDQIHAGSTKVSLSCLLHLQKIIENMDGLLRKANELKEKQGFGEEQPAHSISSLVETAMVGFEEELEKLMDKLINERSSLNVISIVGMGGTGKTTLAQNLYQNSCIKQHFDVRAWVTISQQYNVHEILSQLTGHENSSGKTDDALGVELHKALYGRRYLIVLDDVWNVKARDEVMRYFPNNENRSRVVLTTRLSNVVRGSCYDFFLEMKPLDESYRWKLFCRTAFQQENCPHPELESVGKEIASLCRGLPLSTVVMGGLLLKSPMSLRFWKNVVINIKSGPASKEKEESLDVLSLSYNHLPPHLKPCFLYMGVFKEDSEIRVSNLIRLWIAEGFVRPKNTLVLEQVAEDYLKELIDRNLVSISKRRKNGKVGSCGIHDLMRDLCQKVGQQQEFFHLHTKGEFRGSTERRLICLGLGELLSGPALGRSIFTRSYYRRVAASCKLLKVLYSEGYFEPSGVIYINVNLRYLAFPFSHENRDGQVNLWKLPTAISLLWNLQTLIIKQFHLNSIIVAPIEIWKMRQLKHVKCSRIYLPSDGLFMMDNLWTLTTTLNLRLSKEVCEMIPNIKKLHLLYHRKLHGYDDSFIEFLQNLDCLHKLESLKLSMTGIKVTAESELIKKLAFPTSLNKLSLIGCKLGWEDLCKIGSLPQLQVLELGDSSVVVGNKWTVVGEKFLQLKFLKIDYCNHLHDWVADDSHFPVLENLILIGLGDLKEIPCGIGDITTLKLIRVEYCSESAAISALRIKKERVENDGDDDLQIQLRMHASDLKSFEKMVETEELTLENIQLEITYNA